MMDRAALLARLSKLETLARRSPYPAERDVALAKIARLRAQLGGTDGQATTGGTHRHVRYVDVGDTTSIKDAIRKAFAAGFEDIIAEMRAMEKGFTEATVAAERFAEHAKKAKSDLKKSDEDNAKRLDEIMKRVGLKVRIV